jgi:hypothetical protein
MVSAAGVLKGRKKTDKTKIRTVNKADFFIEPPFRVKVKVIGFRFRVQGSKVIK